MAALTEIIKVTQSQYDDLVNGNSVSGKTYDPNAIYLVDGANFSGGWTFLSGTITSSLCVRYRKMGGLTLLHIHFQNYSITTIGQTVYTITDTTLRPPVITRAVVGLDVGSSERYSCGIDVRPTGEVQVFPHTSSAYSGSFPGQVFGDAYIWLG